MSPNYPENYYRDFECTWVIRAAPGLVLFFIVIINVASQLDYILKYGETHRNATPVDSLRALRGKWRSGMGPFDSPPMGSY